MDSSVIQIILDNTAMPLKRGRHLPRALQPTVQETMSALDPSLVYSSTLKMETVRASETLAKSTRLYGVTVPFNNGFPNTPENCRRDVR
jgi:hypothetical protein